MSLTFDTGLTRSVREVLVGAVAVALAGLRRPTKYLTAIVSLPRIAQGKADEDFIAELARILQGRVPCIAIATGSAKPESISEDALEMTDTIELGVYVISGNQHGVVDGRLFVDAAAATDDTKDPGVFAMLEHVTERLQGAALGIAGIHEPRKTDEDEVATFDDVTIWGQTYSVDVSRTINPDRAATTLMTSIAAKHRGDGIPDATSLDPMIVTVTTPLDP